MSKRKFAIEDFLNRDYPTPKERRKAIHELCAKLGITKSYFYRVRTCTHDDTTTITHSKLIILRDFFHLRKIDDLINEPQILES
jgi:hypothetical protein